MQLDANGFYVDTVSYYVDNHFTVEYPLTDKTNNVSAMVELYKTMLSDDTFTTKVGEILDESEVSASYGIELVDDANKYGNTNASNNVGLATDEENLFMISIYGADEQLCEKLAELVKDVIDMGKTTVTERLGEHELILLNENCDYVADNKLLDYQQTNVNKVFNLDKNLKELKGKLSGNELRYIELYEEEQPDRLSEQQTENTTNFTPQISKKLIVVGFAGGIFISAIVLALLYLFNCRLRLEDNFEGIYNVKLLGNIVLEDKGKQKWFKYIDQFFLKMRHWNKHYFEEQEAMDMITTGIKIAAKQLGTSKAYITGAAIEEDEKQIIEALARELKIAGIELNGGKPILYDAEALEQSAEIGFVVLLEHAGKSLYQEIEDEIEICAHQKVKIIGTVVVA
jgi:hypothetical protein